MYKKILVPIDDSEPSKNTIEHAVDLAKATGGEITLLHVIDVGSLYETKNGKIVSMKDVKNKGNKLLRSAKEFVKEQGVPARTRLKRGDAWYQIVEEAEKKGYDAIVIGAHGKDMVKRILWGSVSENVKKHASCPVVIINKSK